MTDWRAMPSFKDPSVTYDDHHAVFCPLITCGAWPGQDCRTVTRYTAATHRGRKVRARMALGLPAKLVLFGECPICRRLFDTDRDGHVVEHRRAASFLTCTGSHRTRLPEDRPERAHRVVRVDPEAERLGIVERRVRGWLCDPCGESLTTNLFRGRPTEARAWLEAHGGRVEPETRQDV